MYCVKGVSGEVNIIFSPSCISNGKSAKLRFLVKQTHSPGFVFLSCGLVEKRKTTFDTRLS